MEKYMRYALKEAEKGAQIGEIPIGALIEKNGEVIAIAHNMTETDKEATAHAEILAIKKASQVLGGWRLTGCNMYVTVEPCSMCAGAIVLARIENLYIGTMDPKGGGCGSVFNIVEEKKLNHNPKVTRGVLQEECEGILKDFFKKLRKRSGGKK